MNSYRSYFDRVRMSDSQHRRMMDTLRNKQPVRRSRRPMRYAALAACCVLALGLGFFGAVRPTGPATSLDNPNPTGSGVALPPDPIAPPEGSQYTVVVRTGPFENQSHSNFFIPALEYTDISNSAVACGSIILPDGNFTEKLTAEEIIQAVGSTDTIPWPLYWEGYGLTGNVIYDGQGQVWQATIWGEHGETVDTYFSLELRPGEIPIRDTWYSEAVSAEYNGIAYTAWYQHYDRDGDGNKEYVYELEFMDGDTGVCFMAVSANQETAAMLCNNLMGHAVRSEETLTTAHLIPDEIPDWRSDKLTEAQAYEEDLGAWLPNAPAGFAFESAHRELGQNRDWLDICWTKGYDHVSITVTRFPAHASLLAPDFKPDEITADALRELGEYVDNDAGDTPGWRYPSFNVHYTQEDGTTIVVNYSIKGLDPEEAAQLASLTVRDYCYPIRVEPAEEYPTYSCIPLDEPAV